MLRSKSSGTSFFRSLGMLCVTLLLTGCQREHEQSIVEFTGHIFVFNYRVSTAKYLVTLRRLSTFPEGAVAVAEYEDPQGGAPLITKEALHPAIDKIVLESPPLQCVREGRPYTVTVRVMSREDEVLQTLSARITSDFDQSILPAKPIVVGPFYEQNPAVFKADGSKDYTPVTDCPKA
ncbi:hypothetical protein [Rhizobium oryzicola]|uniref:Lipoprotein n=1 Tax=Rhizobium oryzicola TaxID=1232668 RepID=A0ABT8STH0_9HYPH|nr:hypothetical protein [Rhizobium oryzicola]MDO1581713.1 hypothetical protein [Rhizobium oryzicola]